MTKKKKRLERREEKGRPRRFHCILNYHIRTLLYCVRDTKTQPLICVGCSVHYWVSCAINKGGFFLAFVVVVDTHLARFEALAYFLPHFDALTQSTNPFRLCILDMCVLIASSCPLWRLRWILFMIFCKRIDLLRYHYCDISLITGELPILISRTK